VTATEYARLEARRYQKAGSSKDAIEYAKRSIACMERLPQTETNQKKIIDARVVLSSYYINLSYHIEAKEAVEPITDLAVGLNYQKRLPSIYTTIGLCNLWVEEDFSKGIPCLKDVFEIATKERDFLSLYYANYYLGGIIAWNYQFDESMACFKTSLDLSVMANNLVGIALAKSAIAMNYSHQSKPDLALQVGKEALQAATKGSV
jgi:tetratricopeptide (TPR) repeat protein